MIQLSNALIEGFILKCFLRFPEISPHQSEMLQIRNRLSKHLNCWTCNLDMCFLGRGSHITRGMYFPVSQVGTHISVGICVSKVGEHISGKICVSQVGEHISRGICVSQVGEHL